MKFWKNSRVLLAMVLIAGSGLLAGASKTGQVDRAEFQNPSKTYRPWVRWWWPGNDVRAEELKRELGVMDDAGFGGAEIQAFTMGLKMKMPADVADRVLSFGSPSYFEHVLAAVSEADKHGMQIDLTLGSGWPFGGTHITKDLTLRTLLWNEMDVNGPKKFSKRIPPPKKPLFFMIAPVAEFVGMHVATYYKKDFRPVAAVAARPVGKAKHSFKPWNLHDTVILDFDSLVNLTDRIGPEGKLEWQVPKGKWKVIIFYVGPNGTSPTLVAEKNPGLTMDHFSKEALDAHINHVLAPGDEILSPYYGKALRGFFTDSLELKVEHCWTDDFLSEFEKRRGYDLTTYLPALPMPMKHNMVGHIGFLLAPEFDFETGEGDRIRYDVDRTLVELYSERFISPMSQYADSHGLKSRVQAHGMQADILHNYGIAHIPETEQLYAGGNTDFLKMASSGGHVYGRNLVTAESVVWDTRDYMTTPLKIKAAADKLFTAGINGMVFHGFPYTYKQPGFGTPAWAPFSSPFMALGTFSSNFNEENPFFKYLPVINAYITRCQYVLRHGENVADVALYYPLFGYPQRTLVKEELTGGLLDETDARIGSGGVLSRILHRETVLWPEHELVKANVKVADQLMAHGYNYDHVNEDSLLRASVCDDMLCIGEACYRVLVLNRIKSLSPALARKLETLAKEGAAMVFVDILPEGQPGFKDYKVNDPVIKQAMRKLRGTENRVILASKAELAEQVRTRLRVNPDVEFDRPQPSLDYIHRKAGDADYFFFRNSKRDPVHAQARFPCKGKAPEIWNPWTGEVTPVAGYRRDGDRVVMDIEIGSYGSLLVGFDPGRAALMQGSTAAPRELSSMSIKTWHLETELVGTDGSRRPVVIDMEGLKDWREVKGLEGCSSPGRYSATVNLDKAFFRDCARIMLDLGDVRDAAEVRINGKDVATLIIPPFSCNATAYLKPGINKIEILVTPTLYNRLVRWGSSLDKRYKQFKNRRNLMPSGLIGPVSISASR